MKMTITLWLIVINFIVFFLEIIFGNVLIDLFALIPSSLSKGYIWQIFTYMFLHADATHIIFNMFGLLIFGPKIEMTMGSEKFLKFYLICGVGSSLFYLLITGLGGNIPMLGASGAIFGVLTAFGIMYPRDIVYVYFSFPMPAIVFIILYGGLQVLLGVLTLGETGGGIAYFGHVGGLVTAIILLKFFGYERRKIRYFWE
jgi:membrane associated rhomboid family serine protease